MSASWKKNDTQTPEYQRKFTFYILLCLVLGLIGGMTLAYKIDGAETAAQSMKTSPVQTEPGATRD